MKKPMLCGCGERFSGLHAHTVHRESGECPYCAPSIRSGNFVRWALHVRADSPAERARREATAARIAELKANPEWQENAARKKEQRRAISAKRRLLASRRAR